MKIYKPKTLKKNLLKWYSQANSSDKLAGLNWYDDARNEAFKISVKYNIGLNEACQLIAVLSPQVAYEQNLRNVNLFLTYGKDCKIYATNRQKELCQDILDGKQFIGQNSLKIYSFADNIYNRDSKLVTIDRHAIKVIQNDLKGGGVKITPKQYHIAEKVYSDCADNLGLKAYQLQAIVWVTYKRFVGR